MVHEVQKMAYLHTYNIVVKVKKVNGENRNLIKFFNFLMSYSYLKTNITSIMLLCSIIGGFFQLGFVYSIIY